MRKTLLVFLSLALVATAGSAGASNNLRSDRPAVFAGNDLTPDTGGVRILYAPSESDDAVYRAAIAAATGGTCDYFDARYGTPDATLLANYDCVHVWANYAFSDNVTYGNNLADFVDRGGHVVLGAFCAYTSGNYLSGRIMTDTVHYCPVTGGTNHFSLAYWDGTCTDRCVHSGVTSYATTYRDYLTLVASDGTICGRYTDGEIATALNSVGDVIYANGAGGYPLAPIGDVPLVVGNACTCWVIAPYPLGACCLPDGECIITTGPVCVFSYGGVFQGAGVDCTPGLCSATAVEHSTWGELKNKLRD